MKVFVGLLSFFAFGLLRPVHAAEWSGCFADSVPNAEKVATIQCLVPMFTNVVQAIMALTGVALFVMLVVGGFNFLLSGGDPKKLEAARGTLTGAIIGLVVIVLSFLIILTVSKFTGVDKVTQFSIPTEETSGGEGVKIKPK